MLNLVKIVKILLIFFRKKKKEKNCKNLGIGQNLTEFVKILMHESLKNIYNFFIKQNEGI
jgi:cadmium resistance protein CadD (predicted permease)